MPLYINLLAQIPKEDFDKSLFGFLKQKSFYNRLDSINIYILEIEFYKTGKALIMRWLTIMLV